jgi:hypothetical protein
MIARILPREEWGKLDVTALPQIGPTLRPEDVQIAVVEDQDKIVATMAVLRVAHLESLWIAPEYRGNAGLGRRLLKTAIKAAKLWTDSWIWGASDTAHMDDVIGRVGGVPLPLNSFMIPIGGN